MNLGDSLITIFVMLLITSILFIFPLIVTADGVDNASQVTIQTHMESFVNDICDTGKITQSKYADFIQNLAGPNTYNVEIEINVLDENPNKKVTVANNYNVLGENKYITYYTSQIEDKLYKEDGSGCIYLKEGDQVHVYIANTNATISQQLTSPASSDISTLIAETTKICTVNGI